MGYTRPEGNSAGDVRAKPARPIPHSVAIPKSLRCFLDAGLVKSVNGRHVGDLPCRMFFSLAAPSLAEGGSRSGTPAKRFAELFGRIFRY